MSGTGDGRRRPRTLKTLIRPVLTTAAWGAGLALLSLVWMGWALGDGVELLREIVPGDCSARQLQRVVPLTTLLVWVPGVIAARRVHRSAAVTAGIAGLGVLSILAAVVVMFSLRGMGRL